MDISSALSANPYPGRGILLGRSADGGKNIIAYFIMGRSENSRNRIFETASGGIRTRAFDESKCVDPSLIIYSPVRILDNSIIVTNGDQTDTIYDELRDGGSFRSALMRRTFEPDAPNFTPRISGLIDADGYSLSILKSEDGSGTACMRCFYSYEFEPGICHLIHTYEGDGIPLPSYIGEPKRISVGEGCAKALADSVWGALDAENRISLFVRFIDIESGEAESVIINKNIKRAEV